MPCHIAIRWRNIVITSNEREKVRKHRHFSRMKTYLIFNTLLKIAEYMT